MTPFEIATAIILVPALAGLAWMEVMRRRDERAGAREDRS